MPGRTVPAAQCAAVHDPGWRLLNHLPAGQHRRRDGVALPYSTDNLMNTVDTKGWNNRQVPAHSVDVLATGVVNGVHCTVAVRVTQQWAYAVTAAHQIYLSGGKSNSAPGTLPAQIFGNVLDMATGSAANPAVTIGADPSNAYCQNCLVSGTVSLTGQQYCGAARLCRKPHSGASHRGRVLRYPNIQPPDPTTMTDLQSVVGSLGFTLTNEPGTDIWDLDCSTPGAMLTLNNGSFYLNGSLKIAGTFELRRHCPQPGDPACGERQRHGHAHHSARAR